MLVIVCLALAIVPSAIAAASTYDPAAHTCDDWQQSLRHASSEPGSSRSIYEPLQLDLSLAPRNCAEAYPILESNGIYAENRTRNQDDLEERIDNLEMNDEGDDSSAKEGRYIYPWNSAPAGSNKIEIVKSYIQAQPRHAPKKKEDEGDDDFAFRLQKSWELYERKIRTELKHLSHFEEQCQGDQDQTAAMYEERLNNAKEKKRAADKLRHDAKRYARQRLRRGEQVEPVQQSLFPISPDEEDRRIEIARQLYFDCQRKSVHKARLRKAKEAGVSEKVIAEEMEKFQLENLDDQCPIGAIKTAIRKRLSRFPDDPELRMEAEKLGMHPDIKPTPRKGVKGKERWLHEPSSSVQYNTAMPPGMEDGNVDLDLSL